MPGFTAVLTGGAPDQVKSGARAGATYWKLSFDNARTLSIFQPSQWEQAKQLANQPVDVETEINAKGFENLTRLGPAGSLGIQSAQEAPGGFGSGQTTQATSPGFGGSQNGSQEPRDRGLSYQTHPVDAARMGKSKAFEVAFGYAAATGLDPDAAFELGQKIYERVNETSFITGLKTELGAKEITEQVNEELGEGTVRTGAGWETT